ncbi:VOC family protein [Halobacillus andaensis]|uniref:VOC family protein n=1 Tax=Halobacillus andaensis TaxID=1176239 RepID=UPI003D720101
MYQLNGVLLPVTDLEKAKDWYERHLGLIQVDEWSEGAGYVFPAGDMTLALIKVEKKQPSEFNITDDKKNVYFNFSVDDIKEAQRKLRNHNVETTEIEDLGFMKKFDFTDPDGNTLSAVIEHPDSPFHKNQIKKLQDVKF